MPILQPDHEFLRRVYQAYQRKDIDKIERLVSEISYPFEKALLAGLDENSWRTIARSEQKRQAMTRLSLFILGGLIGIISLVVVGVLIFFRPPASPTPTEVITIPVPISSPTLSGQVLPTDSPTEPPTEPPTEALMSPEPSTPVPPSVYLSNPQDVVPALPSAYDQLWVLNNDTPAWISTGEGAWSTDKYRVNDREGKPFNESYQYMGSSNQSFPAFVVTYAMDLPLPVDGLYEILVMDTPSHSSTEVVYEILVDDAQVQPERGVGIAYFNTNADQKDATWLSVGFYRLNAGQLLKINANVPDLPENSFFAADRLVIGLVSQAQADILSALPRELPLGVIIDDLNVQLAIFNGTTFVISKQNWQVSDSLQVWANQFQFLPAGWANKIQVTWGPRGRLPAGTYQLWVHVPDTHASVAEAEYYLLINGQEVDRVTPRILNQSTSIGMWVPVGEYILDATASVQVVMEVKKDVPGEIGIDAVALVRKP